MARIDPMELWKDWVPRAAFDAQAAQIERACEEYADLAQRLSEAVPKSELQPILDGLTQGSSEEDWDFGQLHEARDRLATLLSTDSEEG